MEGFMKRFFFFVIFLTAGIIFSQHKYQVFDKIQRTKIDFEEHKIHYDSKPSSTPRNYESQNSLPVTFIGKMWNAYSTQGSYTNQIFTDPYSGLITVTHRGSRIFPHSGVIVYQGSDDGGANWTQEIGPVGSINFNGRHPNVAIVNKNKSSVPGDQTVVITYPALTTSWYYLLFVRDSVFGAQNYYVSFDSAYYPNDEMFINSKGWVFTTAELIETRIVGNDIIVTDLFYSTDFGFTWIKKPLAKFSDFNNGEFNGFKGFINKDGIGYIIAQGKKPGQNFYTFAYKKTTDDGATWDSTWTWVNPFEFPELYGKVHRLNYEVDIVTDVNGFLNFVGTFVDTVNQAPNNNTGIYHIYGNGNFWKANLVRKVNVTYQELPGGLRTLNECEIATHLYSNLIFIKWADKPEFSDKYDLFGAYGFYSDYFNGYIYFNEYSTQTPDINEKFSQMSSFIKSVGIPIWGTPDVMYTIFANNDSSDLGESDLWFVHFPELIVDYAEDEMFPVVQFNLSQNFPNPFNNKTRLQYFVPYGYNGNIVIKVFNLLGEEITTLVDEHKSPGYHFTDFDGSNLSSGVYIFELRANKTVKKVKGILLK
jgi:hypothetical protein